MIVGVCFCSAPLYSTSFNPVTSNLVFSVGFSGSVGSGSSGSIDADVIVNEPSVTTKFTVPKLVFVFEKFSAVIPIVEVPTSVLLTESFPSNLISASEYNVSLIFVTT